MVGTAARQSFQIGVSRVFKKLTTWSCLHDLAVIDHHHLVGHVGNDTEIVRDQQHRHVQFRLEPFQDRQDLGLDRHIEGRCRFIGNQQCGMADQRHGDHGPLSQAAGQFERIHVIGALRVRKTDIVQHCLGHRARAARLDRAVQKQRLLDLIADRVDRGQGCHRLLKDHRYATTAQFADVRACGVKLGNIQRRGRNHRIIEQDRTARNMRHIRQDAKNRLRDDGFAGTGFADQCHCPASWNTKTDALDDIYADTKIVYTDLEIDNAQKICFAVLHDLANRLPACGSFPTALIIQGCGQNASPVHSIGQ